MLFLRTGSTEVLSLFWDGGPRLACGECALIQLTDIWPVQLVAIARDAGAAACPQRPHGERESGYVFSDHDSVTEAVPHLS